MIRLSPTRTFFLLTAVALTLAAASVSGHALQFFYGQNRFVEFVRLFNISGEGNIPAWFTSFVLLVSSLLLFDIAYVTRQAEESYVRHWQVLALIFLYVSIDEAAEIHEALIQPLRAMLGASGLLYSAWVIPGVIAVLVLGLIYLPFLAHLPTATRYLFVVAAALYVGGALGMELVDGYLLENAPDAIIIRGLAATIEDLCEMMGAIVFVYALMAYISDRFGGVQLKLHP